MEWNKEGSSADVTEDHLENQYIAMLTLVPSNRGSKPELPIEKVYVIKI